MTDHATETYLSGQRAIVTGSGRGIGRAIALELARRGADVAISDVDQESAEAVAGEIRDLDRKSLAQPCNVTDKEQVDALVSRTVEVLGGLEIFVNNAGITRDTIFIRMTAEQWEQVLDVNLKGTFFGCQAAARVMMKARAGSIVNVASVVGLMGNPGQANYSASKAGVITLTRTLAKELAGRGVRVNAVAPGFIETEMTKNLPEKARAAFLEHIPLGRAGTPEDVASAISWLCSPHAAYLTGQTLVIDGGLMDRSL